LVSISARGILIWWDVASGKSINRTQSSIGGGVLVAKFSPNRRQLVTGHQLGRVILWDLDGPTVDEPLETKQHTQSISTLELSPTRQIVASASADKSIRMWDITTGESVGAPIINEDSTPYCVRFSPDELSIASGYRNGTVMLHSMSDSSELAVQKAHTQEVLCLAFSQNSQLLASGSADFTIQILQTNVAEGEWLQPLVSLQEESRVESLVFIKDDKQLLTGAYNGSIKLWDISSGTGTQACFAYDRGSAIQTMALSPNGQYLVVLSEDSRESYLDARYEVWKVDTETRLKSGSASKAFRRPIYFSENSSITWFGRTYCTLFTSDADESYARSDIWCGSSTGWVKSIRSGHHLFKLPPDIEVNQWLTIGNRLVLGAQSGAVVIVDCKDVLNS
jgi:WD40 repeat protein